MRSGQRPTSRALQQQPGVLPTRTSAFTGAGIASLLLNSPTSGRQFNAPLLGCPTSPWDSFVPRSTQKVGPSSSGKSPKPKSGSKQGGKADSEQVDLDALLDNQELMQQLRKSLIPDMVAQHNQAAQSEGDSSAGGTSGTSTPQESAEPPGPLPQSRLGKASSPKQQSSAQNKPSGNIANATVRAVVQPCSCTCTGACLHAAALYGLAIAMTDSVHSHCMDDCAWCQPMQHVLSRSERCVMYTCTHGFITLY